MARGAGRTRPCAGCADDLARRCIAAVAVVAVSEIAPKDRFALFGALRLANAGAGLGFGLLQTAVLARTLPLDSFAHYVLAGALGNALWAFDLGIARVLFTRLRPARNDINHPAELGCQGWA